jgi:hypothetical protein
VSSRAERLFSGPRGRRLCLELAMAADPAVCTAAFALGYQLDPGQGLSRVLLTFESDQDSSEPGDEPARTVAGLVSAVGALGATRVESGLIQSALQRSVDFARYWQEPDGEDRLAALPEVAAALLPLAEAVVESAEVAWWSQAFSTDQWLVQWQTSGGETIPQTPISLTAWSEETRTAEARAERERPRDPHANWSGEWWSVPVNAPKTVGRIPAGLGLVEDAQDWDHAVVVPVRCHGQVVEIASADDWAQLCREFPLTVTASRRHDWFRTTGRDGAWVIPDWALVAGEWDAIHLPVSAYLECAGRVIEVAKETASVIAGWDPDTSIWLAGAHPASAGAPQSWLRDGDDGWLLTP